MPQNALIPYKLGRPFRIQIQRELPADNAYPFPEKALACCWHQLKTVWCFYLHCINLHLATSFFRKTISWALTACQRISWVNHHPSEENLSAKRVTTWAVWLENLSFCYKTTQYSKTRSFGIYKRGWLTVGKLWKSIFLDIAHIRCISATKCGLPACLHVHLNIELGSRNQISLKIFSNWVSEFPDNSTVVDDMIINMR